MLAGMQEVTLPLSPHTHKYTHTHTHTASDNGFCLANSTPYILEAHILSTVAEGLVVVGASRLAPLAGPGGGRETGSLLRHMSSHS